MKQIFTLIMALAIGLASALAEETNVCIGGLYYLLNSETKTAKVYYDDTTYGQTDQKYPNLKNLVIQQDIMINMKKFLIHVQNVVEKSEYLFRDNLFIFVKIARSILVL